MNKGLVTCSRDTEWDRRMCTVVHFRTCALRGLPEGLGRGRAATAVPEVTGHWSACTACPCFSPWGLWEHVVPSAWDTLPPSFEWQLLTSYLRFGCHLF